MSNKKEDIFAVGPGRVQVDEVKAINITRQWRKGLEKKEELNSDQIKFIEDDIIKTKLRLKELYEDFDKGLFESHEKKGRYDFTRFGLLLNLASYEARGFDIYINIKKQHDTLKPLKYFLKYFKKVIDKLKR